MFFYSIYLKASQNLFKFENISDNCRTNCLESSTCQYYKVNKAKDIYNCSLYNSFVVGDLCQASFCDQGT